VYGKLAMMAVEIMIARQITYFSAREKDADRRCDLEAGMAKLLAARIAWSNADNGLQIHGGNGFALEYPISRVLCDARILNIFEGAAEIQAQVIARRLLETACRLERAAASRPRRGPDEPLERAESVVAFAIFFHARSGRAKLRPDHPRSSLPIRRSSQRTPAEMASTRARYSRIRNE
ncbi:MAG: acyl-CoA dehydrogenase family protein, partial [Pseudomonadota bacterium]